MECEFCNKKFKTTGTLNTHKKTAKYCIKIQEELGLKDSELYFCKDCNKSFSAKHNLEKHEQKCIQRFINTIKEIEKHNKELETRVIELQSEIKVLVRSNERAVSTVEEIAKQPRNQTTNNNQKILITSNMDLSQERMKDMIENSFSASYMIQGQKGVAKFAYDTMLKDEEGKLKYICTDPSRQIFQYKNEEGEIKKDVKAKKLTKALLEGDLKSASHKIASDKMKDNTDDFLEYSTYYLEIKELEDDNSDFSKELSTLVI